MDRAYHCWLCMSHELNRETLELKFIGFRLFSAPPWDLTDHGLLESAVYMTTSMTSYEHAQERMLASVRHLAEVVGLPIWKLAWADIDPSLEAHQRRALKR